jgi:hypothetical protein
MLGMIAGRSFGGALVAGICAGSTFLDKGCRSGVGVEELVSQTEGFRQGDRPLLRIVKKYPCPLMI